MNCSKRGRGILWSVVERGEIERVRRSKRFRGREGERARKRAKR